MDHGRRHLYSEELLRHTHGRKRKKQTEVSSKDKINVAEMSHTESKRENVAQVGKNQAVLLVTLVLGTHEFKTSTSNRIPRLSIVGIGEIMDNKTNRRARVSRRMDRATFQRRAFDRSRLSILSLL